MKLSYKFNNMLKYGMNLLEAHNIYVFSTQPDLYILGLYTSKNTHVTLHKIISFILNN